MSKTVDKSGFWFIPHNPISKVGIFDYLGSSISDECEPNKVYKVFRSGETLLASVPTWDNPPKPFINDHEMLGEGFTEIDERPVQGVITNPQYEDGVLYADITVYSEKLKEAIENGKKELSLGYFCKFEKQPGTYEGENYDYIQTNMVGNHIALVDAGRCGSDVKVFDHKCVMDSFDVISKDEGLKKTETSANIEEEQKTETKDSAMADIRKSIQAILAKDSADTEKVEELAELIGKTAKDEEAEKEEKKAEDKCGKDEDPKEEAEKKAEDSDEEEEKEIKDNDDEEKEVKDEQLSLLKKIADGIDELLKKSDEKKEEEKAEDADEESKSEDEDDEEKKSEDEDDEEKEAGDGVLFTFGQDKAIDGEDPAIKAYLA